MCLQFLWLLKYPFSLYLACSGFSEKDDQWHTDAHRAGEISFLGVSAKLFPEGQLLPMWIQWLSKAGDPQNCWQASSNPPNIRLEQKKAEEGRICLFCLIWDFGPLLLLDFECLGFDFQTRTKTDIIHFPSFPAFELGLNYTLAFSVLQFVTYSASLITQASSYNISSF